MNYLTLENVTKSYGDKVLFRDISLHINKGDKVALVAENGTGKTTLLRVIAGEEGGEGENCKIEIWRHLRIGYLKQEPEFDEKLSVLDTVFAGDDERSRTLRAYEQALLKNTSEERLQELVQKMDDLKAWTFESTAKEILFKFNITGLDQPVGSLSGGQQKRLALARLLIQEPDFLILDEPTNHLDLEMIEWLEEYLRRSSLTVFLVTHDRYFLERVCNYIVELDAGSLYKYTGNYSEFLHKKTTREENQRIEKHKAKQLMKKELDWMRRMPKARGTKSKSRINAFDDIEAKAKQSVGTEKVQIDLKGERLGTKILELRHISKRFDDLVLIDDFLYKFKRNERVGIAGKNGTGKTTFLRIITEQMKPDSGSVVIGSTVKFGYYSQDGIQLKEDKRVIDVIRDIAEYIPLDKGQKLTARQLLERFLFDAKKQQVYASQLSGGERRRLYLLTVLMQNPNFLILDEPTNDLDIITLNVLEEFLLQFPGCVVVVSHDRYFMDKIVDHLFVFEGNGKVRDFNGNYTQYRNWKLENDKVNNTSSPQAATASPKSASAVSYEDGKALRRLENQLKKLESRKAEITERFNDTSLSTDKLMELSTELESINTQIEEKEEEWLVISLGNDD